jgi:hypothetical protein
MVLSSSELVNKINKILNGYDDDYDIHETNAFSSLNLMEFAINKLNNKEDFKLTFLVKEKTLSIKARIPTISISVKQFNVRYFGYNNWLINEHE